MTKAENWSTSLLDVRGSAKYPKRTPIDGTNLRNRLDVHGNTTNNMKQSKLLLTLIVGFFLAAPSGTMLVCALAVGVARAALSKDSMAIRSAGDAGIQLKEASPTKGLGAFATTPIAFGEYVGEYSGELMTLKQVRARYYNKGKLTSSDGVWKQSRVDRNQGLTGNYVFEMIDGRCICAEDGDCSGWCRFINHAPSDQCNVKAFDRLSKDGAILTFPQFFAICHIQAGDELLFDCT